MFRAAQVNPFDEVVGKATDENLTQENWEFILDACDKVGAEENGGKDATAALIKRLAHRNANVQLYTLELANSLAQNCGLKIHKELASRSFTDALLRLANDRNTHQQVKAKILERMAEWTEMFARDPDLGIMEQAYMKLKSQNPSLHPPSKPVKRDITDVDRQKEEEELQMALALSIKEKNPQNNAAQKQNQGPSAQPAATSSRPTQQPAQPSVPAGTTAATVSRVRALFDFVPSEPGELEFRKGDIIAVLGSEYKDWWKGSLRGQHGIFPLNYVEKLQDPTQEEIQRDTQTEAEVFAEIKNVEKLLTLLSTSSSDSNVRDNEEITSLYHSTLSIRPKLIELIGKYSQKKDDFTQLNEKFIKARRDYESLLEASMSHAAQPMYGRPPPQNAYGYPSQPQPQPDQRYYTPAPSNPTPEPSYPPQQNGPAPFFFVPPGQQQQPQPGQHPGQSQQPPPQQQQIQQQRPPPQTMSPGPKPNSPPAPYGRHSPSQPHSQHPAPDRHSVASAQELAANPYDPGPPGGYYPSQPGQNPPSSHPHDNRQSPSNHYNPYPQPLNPTSSGHQASYPPPQPSYAPPQAPPAGSPPPQTGQQQQPGGYPGLPPAEEPQGYGAPPPGGYQAFHRQSQVPPPQSMAASAGGARDGVGEPDVSDYYR